MLMKKYYRMMINPLEFGNAKLNDLIFPKGVAGKLK